MEKIKQLFNRFWTLSILAAVLAILFGIVMILAPAEIIATVCAVFALMIGVFALADGIVRRQDNSFSWTRVILGTLAISTGVYLLLNPAVALGILSILVAVFIFTKSIFDLYIVSYSAQEDQKNLHIIIDLIGFICGLVILFWPGITAVVIGWVVGAYAIVYGVIFFSYMIRSKQGFKNLMKEIKGENKRRSKNRK